MVLKKDVKKGFSVTVQLLIANRLGLQQQLAKWPVIMRLCTEEKARELQMGQLRISDM